MTPDPFNSSMLAGAIRHISTTSAVNPTLVATIVCEIVGAPGAVFGPQSAMLIFAFLMLAPLMVLLGQIVFFTIFDRDRLQNDKHVEQKMLINNQLGINRDGKTVMVDLPVGDRLVDNPRLPGVVP